MIIYWHKRDFRLFDNQALDVAVKLASANSSFFVPLLGLEDNLINSPETGYEFSNFHQFGYLSCILPLYKNYLHFGANPILFNDSIVKVLSQIRFLSKVTHLVSHQEHGTIGTWQRDKEVLKFCKQYQIKWIQTPPSSIKRGFVNRDKRDKIFKDYVNSSVLPIPKFEFSKSGLAQKKIIDNSFKESNEEIFNKFTSLYSNIKAGSKLQETSEKIALETLKSFTSSRSKFYRGGISSPNSALIHGSRLSQFLAFGSLSLRFVYQYFWKEIKANPDTKIRAGILGAMQRLHWREHFIQRLESEASMPDVAINKDFNSIIYEHKAELFEKFKTGTTGEVLVDACIRCLLQTGFINFRMRAMLVSYAIFGLDLDWRKVGRFLATIFLDYEPGIHWSQIQMQSGITGINTIRVYSPHKQLLDKDPECIFIKKWIPELTGVDNEIITNYPIASLFEITKGEYPDPAVNFKESCKINKIKTFGVRKKSDPNIAKQVYIKHGSRRKRSKVRKVD
jgi:deoxyribodipyrimidine photo-lyase